MPTLPPLPPGFQLANQSGSMPPLPPGFQLAPQAPPMDVNALREQLRAAYDAGDQETIRRLAPILKQIDAPPMDLGETTAKPVSADSFYQPGFKPLDQARAMLSSAVNQIPVAGPWLEKQAASGQAWLHNTMKPNDLPITQGDVLNTNIQRENANPEGKLVGTVAGNAAPYLLASKFALPAKLLGLEGSVASRLGFTGVSQAAINTGDRMVREGESLPDAAINSIAPTLLTLPLALFGKPTPAGQVVTRELRRAGLTPEMVKAELDRLGPSAVIGDLSPRLQARTGAVATSDGPGRDLIVEALQNRAAGANARIKGAVQDTFGPEPVPSQIAAEMDAARVNANKAYEPVFRQKALSPDFAYDAQPLATAIDNALPGFVGETRAKVAAVGKMLVDPSTGKLTQDPQVILSVRSELDGMIEALKAPGGNRTTVAALTDLRKMIDADLGQQVPGIKWADAGRAEVGQQERGFELGRDALRTGENPIHPQDLQAALNDLAGPAGTAVGPRATPSLAPQRVSEGALSRIYQAIGVTANDRVALKQLLKGDGSWNREKMVSIFGAEKAQKMIDLLDAEATMAETEMLAFGNSKTALMQNAKEGVVTPSNGGLVQSILSGRLADKALDKVTGGIASADRASANRELAGALLSKTETAAPRKLDAKTLALIAALASGNSLQTSGTGW